MRPLRAVRELGARASVIALLVAVAGSADRAVAQWSARRSAAARHRQAGWP